MKETMLIWAVALSVFVLLIAGCKTYSNNSVDPLVVDSYQEAIVATVQLVDRYGGSGSGFHIGHGIFITNHHVVAREDGSFRELKCDGKTARVLASDKDADLAMVLVSELSTYPYFRLSDREIEYGMHVCSVGTHFGVCETISFGSIGGYCKAFGDGYFQIVGNVAINPGCSGGPLLDDELKLIGVNIGILMNQEASFNGVSFFIQSKYVVKLLEEYNAKKKD